MLIFLTLKSLRASYTYNKSVFINAVTRNYQTSSGLRNYFFNKETERSWMFLVKFLVRRGFGEQTRNKNISLGDLFQINYVIMANLRNLWFNTEFSSGGYHTDKKFIYDDLGQVC